MRLHQIMVLLLATFIGLVIFMIFALDRPFAGDLGLRSDPYQIIYNQLMKPLRPHPPASIRTTAPLALRQRRLYVQLYRLDPVLGLRIARGMRWQRKSRSAAIPSISRTSVATVEGYGADS